MKAKEIADAVRLRLNIAPGIAFGPGKADLLEGIRDTGSIAAAGRRMRMSYKRAWQLVDMMNHVWAEPLVEANTGGTKGGGARLTPMAVQVLDAYRALDARVTKEAIASPELAVLSRLLQP